ncbi:uncharacterized protein LOC106532963 [Austrofundulus limnaeus]|uniref:Uncharacterized protein LOC106532963 n=1 Tax=Austrofundulus limnaeus TaxID=52670 RepID=A0A2I4CX93_AUSLI|nr:PREDICTED: uncharacterized protein LOC106532963 [Austrofundulus limnaeus]
MNSLEPTKSHVTIRRGLTFPPLRQCTTCCPPGLYHCPFCLPGFFKPTKRSRVRLHLEIHIRRACFVGEYTIHKCSLDCITRPHYHCLYCISPLLSRLDLNRHVLLCEERLLQTTAPPQDGGAELGRITELLSNVESEEDSELDDVYVVPDHQDRTDPEWSSNMSGSHLVPRSKKPKMAGRHGRPGQQVRRQCHRMVQTNMEKPQDCDEFYFMNLVKMFKKLTPHKKTEVRMKIERILFEAEFQ